MVEPFERLIISFGKSVVPVEADNADRGEFCFQHLDRVIGRTVICYDNLRPIPESWIRRKEGIPPLAFLPFQFKMTIATFFILAARVYVSNVYGP